MDRVSFVAAILLSCFMLDSSVGVGNQGAESLLESIPDPRQTHTWNALLYFTMPHIFISSAQGEMEFSLDPCLVPKEFFAAGGIHLLCQLIRISSAVFGSDRQQ